MITLQEKYEKMFLSFCQKGKISELCILFISYTPTLKILHEGMLKSIQFGRGNTVNFLFNQFNEINPHHNNNEFFLEALKKPRYQQIKSLTSKLVKSKLFDQSNLNSILYEHLEQNYFIDNRHIRNWKNFAFFKYLPKHIQESIKNNEINLKMKLLDFFKVNKIIKNF